MSVLRHIKSLGKSLSIAVFCAILWREIKRFAHISHWQHPRRRQDRLLILLSFLLGLGGTAFVENLRSLLPEDPAQIAHFDISSDMSPDIPDETASSKPNITAPASTSRPNIAAPKITITTPTAKRAFIPKELPEEPALIYEEVPKYAHIPLPMERPDFSNRQGNNLGNGVKKLAIVIDDLGMDRRHTRQIIELPAPLTLAFLPYAENLELFLTASQAKNHEIIIHMPMQPKGPANPGPHALKTSMGAGRLYQEILWNFSQFNGYVGINNHMGSLFTENEALMSYVLSEVARRKIYFLDSRTTSKSVGKRLAQRYGASFAQRDVFLDNIRTRDAINRQFRHAERILQKYGKVIVIGHPYKETVAALRSWIQTLPNNVKRVPVSELVTHYPAPETQEASGVSAAPGLLY